MSFFILEQQGVIRSLNRLSLAASFRSFPPLEVEEDQRTYGVVRALLLDYVAIWDDNSSHKPAAKGADG